MSAPVPLRVLLPLYASLLPLVALLITAFQVYRLSFAGTLPDPYIGRAALVNLGLAFACGLAAMPPVLALLVFWKRFRGWRPGGLAALGAVLGGFLPFWFLNAPHGEAASIHGFLTPTILGSGPWALCFLALIVVLPAVFRKLAGGRFIALSVGLQLGMVLLLASTVWSREQAFSRTEMLGLDRSATRRPHVFIILVDTLRADHLTVYGYDKPTSPHLEEFAREAVLFERAIAPSSWTRPSCASLLTGLYPPDFGGLTLHTPLPPGIPTLPQFLRAEGYRTGGVVASVHVSPLFGFQKGFDVLDNGETFLRSSGTEEAFELLGVLPPAQAYFEAEEVMNRAVEWLDSVKGSGDPLFMYLHFKDPHVPYDPPEPFDWRKFASAEAAKLPAAKQGASFRESLSPLEAEAMVAAYDGEIRYFDEVFGRFLAYLRDNGLYEDSLIFFVADHGEEFFDHQGWGHAYTLFKEVLHIPMLVHYPGGVDGGRRIRQEVSLVDVVPTVEQQLSADWQADFRGLDLRKVSDADAPRWIYADLSKLIGYAWEPEGHDHGAELPPGSRTLYLRPHKLVQWVDEAQNITQEHYFDFEGDFPERAEPRDPAGIVDPGELDAMRTILRETYAGNRPSDGVEFDPATAEKLKALGYLN